MNRRSATCSDFMSLANEIIYGATSNFVGTMTNVEGQPRLRCDHIRGSGLGFDLPDSRDQPVDSLSRALDRADPLGRARESIAAEMHGRCAGVIRATKEREFHSALTGDCFDGCKWLIQFLQYRTLFDVKLKVAERVVFQLGLRNLRGIQAELFDRLANGNALRILDLQKLPIQTTHQRAAADERSAEAYSFLFGKANHLNGER